MSKLSLTSIKAGDMVGHRFDGDVFKVACTSLNGAWVIDTGDIMCPLRATHVDLLASCSREVFERTLIATMQTALQQSHTCPHTLALEWAIENYIRYKPSNKVALLNNWHEAVQLTKGVRSRYVELAKRILHET